MVEQPRPETDGELDHAPGEDHSVPPEIRDRAEGDSAQPESEKYDESEEAPSPDDAAESDGTAADEAAAEPWIELAAPYVQRLAKHLAKEGVKNHSVSLPIGNHRVLVTPQEQKLVLQAGGETGSDEPNRYLQLVCDGIGMQVGILALIRSFVKAEGSQRGPLHTSLSDAVKAANFLAFEMHRQASVLSSAGDFESARQCGEYRKNLLDAAERGQEVLGGDPDTFELPAGAIATSRRRSRMAVSDAAERSAKELAREKARQKLREEQARRRKKISIVIAVICFVVLAGVLGWLWRQRPVTLEHFSPNDFSKVPGFVTVAHREPAIIIVVDAGEWGKLSENQKRGAVAVVVDVVQTAGYREIEFRSQGRAGLAWWRPGKGIEISKN